MFYWMKPLPEAYIDPKVYKPFIKKDWFRKHFMWFVYGWQFVLVCVSSYIGVWDFANIFGKVIVFVLVYAIHELLHIAVVYRMGDLSLTHSGIFCWLNSGAEMSKYRFWLFMTLPLLVLTMLPAFLSLFCSGEVYLYTRYIAWINAIIAGADIINSVLILIKPGKSVFYRGYYRLKE